MSHTTRAMLGLPHDTTQVQIGPSNVVMPEENDVEVTGTSYEAPGVAATSRGTMRCGSAAAFSWAASTAGAASTGKRARDDELCAICWQEERNAVYVPCGHLAACLSCAQTYAHQCPICRQSVTKVQQVFRS